MTLSFTTSRRFIPTISRRNRQPLLYERVDGFDCGGRFVLMELELIVPFLFLRLESQAAGRLAKAIDKLLSE